jgi:hypothetical protein
MRASVWLSVGLAAGAACSKGASPEKVVANKPPEVAPAPQRPPQKPPASAALYRWPVAPFTKAQADEVNSCDTETLVKQRYPDALAVDALASAFARKTPCDHVTMAAACADRLGHAEPPPGCVEAYRDAVKANPAFAFSSGILGTYFDKAMLVDPPPAASHKVTKLVLQYKWTGEGDVVEWMLSVDDAGRASVTGAKAKTSANVSAQLVAFGTSLDSFMPIPQPLETINCFDNYPEWTATIDFDDHSKLELSTHKSNLIGIGGPWQTTLDGVTYMQLGTKLPAAVAGIVKALELPLGEPMGMTCHGFDLQHAVLK